MVVEYKNNLSIVIKKGNKNKLVWNYKNALNGLNKKLGKLKKAYLYLYKKTNKPKVLCTFTHSSKWLIFTVITMTLLQGWIKFFQYFGNVKDSLVATNAFCWGCEGDKPH